MIIIIIFIKWIRWGLIWWPKIPCGSPTISTLLTSIKTFSFSIFHSLSLFLLYLSFQRSLCVLCYFFFCLSILSLPLSSLFFLSPLCLLCSLFLSLCPLCYLCSLFLSPLSLSLISVLSPLSSVHCLSVCLSVYLSIFLSIFHSLSLSLSTPTCICMVRIEISRFISRSLSACQSVCVNIGIIIYMPRTSLCFANCPSLLLFLKDIRRTPIYDRVSML